MFDRLEYAGMVTEFQYSIDDATEIYLTNGLVVTINHNSMMLEVAKTKKYLALNSGDFPDYKNSTDHWKYITGDDPVTYCSGPMEGDEWEKIQIVDANTLLFEMINEGSTNKKEKTPRKKN
jgi:hypothetical protein